MTSSIGILGIGTYLPPEVRRNEWWPAEVVQRWTQARGNPPPTARPATPAMEHVLRAISQQAVDPFRGVIERRVMPREMTSADMESAAAEAALLNADVDRKQIELLLVHTAVPEFLLANSACVLHHRLGLPAACLALEVQASAYSFMAQLELAASMIETGRIRHALLIQSSAASRLIDPEDPVSVALGDAATAVIVGRVTEPRGIIASAHRSDGTCSNSLVASVRGQPWYDGKPILHVANPGGERQLFLETVDCGVDVISSVLAAAQLPADAVDFFAVHQGTPWLRALTQEHAGLSHARSVDLFARTGYVFAASLPLVLATGAEQGLFKDRDLVMLFGGGTGITYGATIMRWGR